MKPKNPIEIKAKMLCEGVNTTPEIEKLFNQQNPFKVKRGGLSSGGKMSLMNGTIFVNAPFYRKRKVDLKLISDPLNPDDGFIVNYRNGPLCTGKILKAPEWYTESVKDFSITQILTLHNRQLAGAIYEDCALFGLKEECKFCVINHSLKNKSPLLVKKDSRLFIEALTKIPTEAYDGLTLNGGMTPHPGRGMEIIEPVVKDIFKAYPNLDIAVEITPPTDLSWIDRLKDAGVASLMMNLECWDDEIRNKTVPGKNKLCSKETYLKAFEHAVQIFGKGKVSSCFIVGIEKTESLKDGIQKIINLGVVPSLLAGRYFEDIPNYPFTPEVNFYDFLDVVDYSNLMMMKKLKTIDKSGCVACGLCDIRDLKPITNNY